MVIGTYISITTLNVNRLNAPSKRHRLAEWIQKQDPYICCLQETHFRPRDKIDLKIKTITRDKEGHYIMIKWSIEEEDITIVNVYAPNTEAPQYIRQMLTAIKGEIDSHKIIVGDFNTPLSPMDRSSKMKKENKKHKL